MTILSDAILQLPINEGILDAANYGLSSVVAFLRIKELFISFQVDRNGEQHLRYKIPADEWIRKTGLNASTDIDTINRRIQDDDYHFILCEADENIYYVYIVNA